MRKFTKLWQLMIVLLLSSGMVVAQKSNTGQIKSLNDAAKAALQTKKLKDASVQESVKAKKVFDVFENKTFSQTEKLGQNVNAGGVSFLNYNLDDATPKPISNVPYDPAKYPSPKQGGDNFGTALVISSLPFDDLGTTLGYLNDYDAECPYTGSTAPDVVYSYTPATNIMIDASLCNDPTDYDTKLYIMDAAQTVIACNDDACATLNFPYAYVSSVSGVALTGGVTYYIVVDGYGTSAGNYELTVNLYVPPPPCVWGTDIVCPAGATDESEACGDDTNGGCNMATPAYEPVPSTGGTICGTTWADASTRDTDWYTLTLTQQSSLVVSADADQLIIYGGIADANGILLVNPTCATVSQIAPNNYAGPCSQTQIDFGTLDAGTYWFFVGMTVYDGFPCDNHYWIDFSVVPLTCPAPTNLAVSNLNGTTADFSWSDANAANTYDIVWGLSGFDPTVGPYTGQVYGATYAGPPYTQTLTGLTLGVAYDVYVRSDCGGGEYSSLVGLGFYSAPPPSNDDCVNAEPVTGPYPETVNGTLIGATVDCPGVLDWNAVWYEVTLPYAVNNMHVDYCGTGTSQSTIGIVYYTDCSDCNAYVVANAYSFYDCGSPAGVTVGQMDFSINGPGTVFFPVYMLPVMDFTVTFNVTELVIPSNDDCANALAVGEVTNLPFNTIISNSRHLRRIMYNFTQYLV